MWWRGLSLSTQFTPLVVRCVSLIKVIIGIVDPLSRGDVNGGHHLVSVEGLNGGHHLVSVEGVNGGRHLVSVEMCIGAIIL